jgi:ribosomal protein L39E
MNTNIITRSYKTIPVKVTMVKNNSKGVKVTMAKNNSEGVKVTMAKNNSKGVKIRFINKKEYL